MPRFELSRLMPRAPWRRRAAAGLATGLAGVLFVAWAAPAFDPEAQPTGWVTRPALTSNNLSSGTETIFRADYKGGLWTGTVVARHIDANGNELATSPWPLKDTAAVMAGAGATWWDTGRRIYTRTSAGAAVPFRLSSPLGKQLDSTQETALGGGGKAQKLLDFVRGDRSEEAPSGSKLRKRYGLQGDILHSTLLYWKHATTTGERRLYVGGNDGMLHAFDAASGTEVFAYVPSMLIPKLPKLAANPYVHTPFVDGGLAIADVTLSSGTRTLLAGALGGGGKGLFMLDVTNPTPAAETVAAAQALIRWEITPASTGFANLGWTYAAPRLARLNNGKAAVVVGNGYLNSGNGRATLLLIDADTGALIREIDTGSGSLTSPNGLSTPTLVDANRDGKVDHAYAGDIDGKLWRFDLASTQSGDWSATLLLATSPAQAITTAPVVASHPAGGRMVVFGTGRILDENDVEDSAVHFVYGLWDGAPPANEAWLDQTVTEVQSGSQRLRLISSHTPNWSSGGHRGWRLTLPGGERVVGDGQFISDDRFYFVGTDPTVTSATAFSAEGASWFMEVQYLTGGSPARPIFDLNADGVIDASDNVGGGVVAGKYLGEGVSSQAVLADQTQFGQALFNRQSDIDVELPKVGTDSGVSGGHFDLDFYVTSNNVFNSVKHTHQYDDKYNVTGVNFLNASDATYNLGSRLGSGVRFKVLAINQYLSPASQLQIGGGAFVSVKNYGALTTTADPAAALAGLPAYTLSTVSTLTWKIGAEGFTAKDWWGDGGVARAGLIPSKTGCVKNITSQGGTGSPGPNGEVHNGAMTLQVIKEETPASALEPNHRGGDLKYGWRVKTSEFTKYVLAEYTMFWHHPSGKCYGDVGWVPNPTKSTGTKVTLTTVGSGSADPNEGTAEILPKGVTITDTAVAMVGATTTVTVTYSDKKTSITEITNNGNGTETVVLTDRNGVRTTGTRMSAGAVGQAPDETLVASRRINWREVVRP